MKLADVSRAIRTRLIADGTLTNTLVGSSSRILMGQVPKSADFSGNCLIYNIYGVNDQDTASGDVEQIDIEFVARVLRDGAQGPDAALSILDRLHGDWQLQVSKVPSFGLHRYKPTLIGGVAETHQITALRRVSYGPVDVEDPELYVAYEATYSGYITTLP